MVPALTTVPSSSSSCLADQRGLQPAVATNTNMHPPLDHAQDMVHTAALFQSSDGVRVRIRVGIHSGPVVAAVVGSRMPHYGLFGKQLLACAKLGCLCRWFAIDADACASSALPRASCAWTVRWRWGGLLASVCLPHDHARTSPCNLQATPSTWQLAWRPAARCGAAAPEQPFFGCRGLMLCSCCVPTAHCMEAPRSQHSALLVAPSELWLLQAR